MTEIDSERHVAASLPYSWHGSVDEEDGWRLKRLPHGVVKSSVERAGGGGFVCSIVKKWAGPHDSLEWRAGRSVNEFYQGRRVMHGEKSEKSLNP